jgi:hypothetical protein
MDATVAYHFACSAAVTGRGAEARSTAQEAVRAGLSKEAARYLDLLIATANAALPPPPESSS